MSTRCSRCPETATHLVRTVGGVHRACATCAEDLAVALAERVVNVSVLPGAATAPPKKRAKRKKVWDEAAELLPGNEFAAQITGMLAGLKGT